MKKLIILPVCFLLTACAASTQDQFNMLDVDKDSFVTLSEFKATLGVKPAEDPMSELDNDVAKTLFTRTDTNNDGKLTLEEYAQGTEKGFRR